MKRSRRTVLVLAAAGAILSLGGCGGGDAEEQFAEDTASIEWNPEDGGSSLLELGYETCTMLDEGSGIFSPA